MALYSGKIPFPNPNGSVTMIDNKEFDLQLKFLEVITPSKKAPSRKRYIFVDQNGSKFSAMKQEYDEIMAMVGPLINTQFVRAGWTFAKRGNAFGLKFVTLAPGINSTVTGRTNSSQPNISNGPRVDNTLSQAVAQANAQQASQPQPVVKQRTTLFALCVDSSGSMGSIRRETTVGAVNAMIQSIRDACKQNNQLAKVMLMKFGTGPGDIETVFGLTDIDRVQNMKLEQYKPDGGTPLFECMGRAIAAMQATREFNDPDVSFFVHAITDGQENQSRHPFSVTQVNKTIADMQATDRWTFAVQVPKNYVDGFIRQFNVPAGNVQGWEISDRGIEQASFSTSKGVSSYMQSRSIGVRSVKNVYTTDMSNVKVEDLKSKLLDVSNAVKFMKVEKEATIKEFAEEKTKVPYVTGSVYYCLTKKETVQPYKFPEFLIRVKNTKTVYGGPEACKLVGIDPTQTSNITVIPGNHSNYDIYVPSTSVNRKLVRGTDTIYLPRAVPMKETWDSAAAQAAADLKKQQAAGSHP